MGKRQSGIAFRPVPKFIPTYRQHAETASERLLPLVDFESGPGDMPYRRDRIGPFATELETVRRSQQPFKLGSGYRPNGGIADSFAFGDYRSASGYVMGGAGYKRAADFTDGAGDTVPFGYERNTQQLTLGWMPTEKIEVFGMVIRDEIDDGKNAASNFDVNVLDRRLVKGGIDLATTGSWFDRVRGEIEYLSVDFISNNFELKLPAERIPQRRVEGRVERHFLRGSLFVEYDIAALHNRFGVRGAREARDGLRFIDDPVNSATPLLNEEAAFQFPDIRSTRIGPFWEGAVSLTPDLHLGAGVSYEFQHSDAKGVDRLPNAPPFDFLAPGIPASPRNYFAFYYGTEEIAQNDHLLSGRFRIDQKFLSDNLTLSLDLSSVARAPDTKERYYAIATPPTPEGIPGRFVGNPALDPERHNRVEIGAVYESSDWRQFGQRVIRPSKINSRSSYRIALAGYYDHVDGFISRDRARRQPGILQNDGARIYRNVDARFFGIEGDVQWNLSPSLSTRLNVNYLRADNLKDERPIYAISPLEANWLLDYHGDIGENGFWQLGAKLRLVADQNRVDDDAATGSGLDEGKTSGVALLDAYAGVQIAERFALRLGVDNLLDTSFQEHVARADVEGRFRRRVSGPGRSVYLMGIVSF